MPWWAWWRKDVPAQPDEPAQPHGPDHTLSDIIRGIAHAAATADEIQDRHFIKHLQRYFEQQEDGSFIPKYARILLPGQDHYVDVPLISLMDPGTLHLGEMEVRMGIRMSKSEVKEAVDDAGRKLGVSRSSFQVQFTSAKPGTRQDVMDITMKFKRPENLLEGVSRIVEDINQTITPKPLDENTEPPKRFSEVFTRGHLRQNQAPEDGAQYQGDSDQYSPLDPEEGSDDALE